MKRIVTIFVLLLVLGLAQAGTVSAAPATFTVNQTADLVDADLSDGHCDTNISVAGDQCSLRAAIQQANATLAADTIKFVSTAAHTLTRNNGADSGANGDLDITRPVTLEPIPGGKTTIQGAVNFNDRIFEISNGANVTLRRVIIQKGNSGDFNGGGGILVRQNSTLTLVDTVISDNISTEVGGGIMVERGSFVTLDGSLVDNNSADDGGGIFDSGDLILRNTTIKSNQTFGRGGGIYNELRVTVINSTVSGNRGGSGGGLYGNARTDAVINIVNSTISGNQSLFNGGGIELFGGQTNLFNVTIAANIADSDNNGSGRGGGIQNSSGDFNLRNTLIANNIDLSASDFAPDCAGTITSGGYNAIENGVGCTIAGSPVGNRNGTDPKLGPLQLNGGATATHALLADSIAIDAGDPAGCRDNNNVDLATDQRGFPSPTDGDGDGTPRCDIGAFEVGAVGIGSVSPRRGSSEPGEQVAFDLAWDSPTRWRDLNTLDLRFKRNHQALFWLRFTEGLPNSTISLLDQDGNVIDSGNVGDAKILKNKFGSLDVAASGFTASGPNDPHVVIHFAVKFKKAAEGKLRIQMLATDDFANAQGPERGGVWHVKQ